MPEATKTTKRTRDPEAKKRAILNAALRELALHGYGGFRADKIALIAGVSVGTIFKIFPDKKNLANAVYMDCLQEVQTLLAPALTKEMPARDAFDLMWKAYTDLFFRNPNCLAFFEYQLTADFLDPHSRLGLSYVRQGLLGWIKKQQAQGILKNNSDELLRALAIGSIMRVVRESLDGHLEMTPSKFKELNEMVWDAIAVRRK